MSISAVVTAGDRAAARAVYGESKVFLEIGGRPLVARVVASLQRVPEVSEVWVVGDAKRLRAVFDRVELGREIVKPLHILEQFRNLYENAWQCYRRLLPDAGAQGRDPEPADLDTTVLYVSGDLPFATPQEISQFVRRGLELGCDYAVGLVSDRSMAGFLPAARGGPGIRMASFNLREGRFRQSNLHLVRPARIGNLHYVEDMYQHRHQKELGQILGLAWTLLVGERGGLRVMGYYALMHLAGLADRRGWRRLADRLRRWIPIARVERSCSDLLRTDFRFVFTEIGGCALDIDNEHDYDVSRERFEEWRDEQNAAAERLYGPLPLPEGGAETGRGTGSA